MEDTSSDTSRADLDAALLRAHAEGATARLISLYGAAGQSALAEGRIEAGSFYLTHARVFALEAGDSREPALHAQLIALGRDS